MLEKTTVHSFRLQEPEWHRTVLKLQGKEVPRKFGGSGIASKQKDKTKTTGLTFNFFLDKESLVIHPVIPSE